MNAISTLRSPRLLGAALLALAACDGLDDLSGPGDDLEPLDLEVRYEWILERWSEGSDAPVGRPAVHVTWSLPEAWDGEAFRVYSRRRGDSDYVLAATVTSCARGLCAYTDLNVSAGGTYDYYVATVDERDDLEVPTESALRVEVPATPSLATPGAPALVALDGAVYLRWTDTGVETYRVFLEAGGGEPDFLIGETDGTSFLDERAVNGTTSSYRIAGVDSLGHVSNRSALASATPRPDYHAEIAYAYADSTARSGFRFPASDADDPILSGDAAAAQWRLERTGDTFLLVPRGSTQVSDGTFTTALACGPGQGSEECVAVTTASGVPLRTTPVPLRAGDTYVLRVTGADGAAHYGKVRVIGTATDSRGLPSLVFDWAYQLRANTPALSRQPG